MALSLGLMSGTSLDGVDAALLETDGGAQAEPLGTFFAPYSDAFRSNLRRAIAGEIDPATLEVELTDLHADAVAQLLQATGRKAADIDLIGFHAKLSPMILQMGGLGRSAMASAWLTRLASQRHLISELPMSPPAVKVPRWHQFIMWRLRPPSRNAPSPF